MPIESSSARRSIIWLVGKSDRAVSFIRATGTHQGPLRGLAPTGRKVELNAIGVRRFASGRAIERWGFGGSAGILQQLGLA
jgi:predicted ester cyclase